MNMSMETLNNYSVPKKEKVENETTLFGRSIRKYLPNLEELIVRKTQADRRKALFGKDPFLG
jgi:hypothetical protein